MWTSGADTSSAGTPWRPACRRAERGAASLLAPPEEEGLEPFQRRLQLVALDGPGRIDVLGTDLGAFTHEGAAPDPVVPGEDLQPLPRPLVARVEVVALGQGDGGRPEERRIQAIHRTGGVAQHAVDAHAELLVLVHLFRRLQVGPPRQRLFPLSARPG